MDYSLLIGDDFPATEDDWSPEPQLARNRESGDFDTDFGRLVAGKTIGKRIVVNPRSQNIGLDMLEVSGSDGRAIPIRLVLSPPQIIPGIVIAGGDTSDKNGLTGEVDNEQSSYDESQGNATVTIDWGIGGTSASAECDFNNGLVVNLVASFLRVRASFTALPSGFVRPVVLRAFAGPGNSGTNQAQNTITIGGLLAGAASAVLPTPRFAKTVTPAVVMAVGLPDFSLTFFRDLVGGFPTARYHYSAAAGNVMPGAVEIPNGSMFFQVINNSGNPAANVNVVFNLAL